METKCNEKREPLTLEIAVIPYRHTETELKLADEWCVGMCVESISMTATICVTLSKQYLMWTNHVWIQGATGIGEYTLYIISAFAKCGR